MELLFRATVLYWFLFLVMRGAGKRSLADLSPLDMLMLIVMGDLIQQGVNQDDMSIVGAMTAVSVFLMWTLLGDWVARKSKAGRRVLVGRPVMVVRDGQILTEIVERERMAAEDILAAAREQGFADLSGISVVVLEDDGKLSFVPKPDGPKPGSE